MAALSACIAGFITILSILVLVLTAEIASAARRGRRATEASGEASLRPGVAVLMPAHDEAAGIGDVLALLRPQLDPGIRLLVVADNCTDDTARIARAAGAEVIERCDAARRGKGFALDFGVRHLAANPPDVVVVLDADCRLAPGALERLATEAAASRRPVQGCYLMRAPADARLGTRVSELAFLVKNRVRPAGLARLGLPCHLTGTGMAFPWPLIRDAHLAHAGLVEDMRLGLELAAAGVAPRFCEAALVESDFPVSSAGAATQRRRWEEGHLGMIAFALSLLPRMLARGRLAAAMLVLDTLVPPLTLLVALVAGCFATMLGLTLVLGWSGDLAAASGGTLALLLATLGFAWWRFGREALPPRLALHVGPYVLGKLGLYVRVALGSRSRTWVRTDRSR